MLATGANALETAAAVEQRLDELRPYFPEGLDAVVPFETTPFVRTAIQNVLQILVGGHRAGVPRHVPVPAEFPAPR
ncbi:MAG: efflux RND transporter permease subunit [Woeseiaceae bacterium]|nr:efflux RND transporter permease subunit [Woeseiaceae bacterium]